MTLGPYGHLIDPRAIARQRELDQQEAMDAAKAGTPLPTRPRQPCRACGGRRVKLADHALSRCVPCDGSGWEAAP